MSIMKQCPNTLERHRKILTALTERIEKYFDKTDQFMKQFSQKLQIKQQTIESALTGLFYTIKINTDKQLNENSIKEKIQQKMSAQKNRHKLLLVLIQKYRRQVHHKISIEENAKLVIEMVQKKKNDHQLINYERMKKKELNQKNSWTFSPHPLICNPKQSEIKLIVRKRERNFQFLVKYNERSDVFTVKLNNQILHTATLQFNFHRNLGQLYDSLVCTTEYS